MKWLGACVDCGLLNPTTYAKFLANLVERQANYQNTDALIEAAVHGYLLARQKIVQDVGTELEQIINKAVESRSKSSDNSSVFKSVHYENSIEQIWNGVMLSSNSSDSGNVELFESKMYNLYLRPSKTYRQELQSKNIQMIDTMANFDFPESLPDYRTPNYFNMYMERCIEASDRVSYALSRDLCRQTLLNFKENPFFACQRLTNLRNIPMLAYLVFDVIFDEIFRLGHSKNSSHTIFYSGI